MLSKLISIPLDGSVHLGPLGNVPVFGAGLLLACWCLFGLAIVIAVLRQDGLAALKQIPLGSIFSWVLIAVVIFQAPHFDFKEIPVYGYGTMLFLGFLACSSVGAYRLRQNGYDGELAWEFAMWIFVSGIAGARLWYVVQYPERFFLPDQGLVATLKKLVNLPDGGLVLYGGVISGAVAYYVVCYLRRLNPLALADIFITSVFIAVAFGRVGCLLNGCCYGDVCSLPWAITFPQESVPFVAEWHRGLIEPTAKHSLPLHPTQIYSALDGVVLALLTLAYYPGRRRNGDVLVLGWLCYPVSRFAIETLRGDELGKFNTSLTISQWFSIAMFVSGLVLLAFLHWPRGTSAAPLPKKVSVAG